MYSRDPMASCLDRIDIVRYLVTLKDGSAMERATGALAKFRYTVGGEFAAPERHPRQWKEWLLEVDSAEIGAIRDHVDDSDIVDIKPVSEPASLRVH
jgi:hypothetical protein